MTKVRGFHHDEIHLVDVFPLEDVFPLDDEFPLEDVFPLAGVCPLEENLRQEGEVHQVIRKCARYSRYYFSKLGIFCTMSSKVMIPLDVLPRTPKPKAVLVEGGAKKNR